MTRTRQVVYNNRHVKISILICLRYLKSHTNAKQCTGRRGISMSEVKVNNGNIEDALKRCKRQCARNGVLQEVRKREHYEKPSVKRKKKSEAARKRKF